jgi:hypothetical protein
VAPAPTPVVHRYRVTKLDRRQINALLNRWMPAAVGRKSANLAWQLAGPELRSGSTLREWRKGTTPVPSYPLLEKRFDNNWSTIDVGKDYVDFNLLVHAKKSAKLPSWVFAGQVVRRGSGWAVNRLYTIAIMNGNHEFGPADVGAPAGKGDAGPAGNKGTLASVWLLPAAGVMALVLVIPLSFGALALVNSRRQRRKQRAEGRDRMPPLPASYRKN